MRAKQKDSRRYFLYLYSVKEIGAIFKNTSAKNSCGIDVNFYFYFCIQELFETIGMTVLESPKITNSYLEYDNNESIKIEKKLHSKESKKKKKGCCK